MKWIEVTQHARARYQQRFDTETFNGTIIEQQMAREFREADYVCGNETKTYKYNNTFYVSAEYEDKIVIITVYSDSEIEENGKRYRLDFRNIPIELQSTIRAVFDLSKIEIIKHIGSKKLGLVDGFLLMFSEDHENDKVFYTVKKIWTVDVDLIDKRTLNKIRRDYFQNAVLEWDSFVSKLYEKGIKYY